jgi:hypothetical protein
MTLNGWQRIGIVVAVIWMSIASGAVWNERHDLRLPKNSIEQIVQKRMLPPPEGYKLDAQPSSTGILDGLASMPPPGLDKEAIFFAFLLWAVFPPLAVWLAISLVVVTVRWIRRGLAAQ